MLDKAEYSAFQSTLNSPIVSYRIVSYFYIFNFFPTCLAFFMIVDITDFFPVRFDVKTDVHLCRDVDVLCKIQQV